MINHIIITNPVLECVVKLFFGLNVYVPPMMHHWWNIDIQTKKQFDHTFKHWIGDDYVVDHDITWNILRRLNYYLTQPVCSSLILSDSRYKAMDLSDEGDVIYRDLSELSFRQLCPKIAGMPPLSEKAMQHML